jgi:hypothetical protein
VHRQRSHSLVRVPQDPWLYFAISRLKFSYLEGQVPEYITPRNRVAQLHPRALGFQPKFGRPSGAHDQIFVNCQTVAGLLMSGRPLLREVGSVVYPNCKSKSKSRCDCLGVESRLGLVTRYLLLFESCCSIFMGSTCDEMMGLSFVSHSLQYYVSCQYVHQPSLMVPEFWHSALMARYFCIFSALLL